MEESNIKILILEDDSTLGEALKEAFSRAGHQVFLTAIAEEASTIISKEKIDYFYVDILMPQTMGVDYVVKVRKEMPTKARFKVIFMSGIYTDKEFINEALKKTQAVAFLKKPFDLPEALSLIKVDESTKKEDVSPRKSLYQIFGRSQVSNREKRKLIEALEEVSGFDLPFVYSLLVETKSSGHLNIYGNDGKVSGVSFANGVIVGVDIEDKNTFLGEMLIQSGYSLPEDVQQALSDKSPRRLGQRLIHANKLSPHAFDLILTEQMNIRLSRTILDQMIRINFASVEVEMSEPSIDSEALTYFLHDWIASKLSLPWLKSMHLMWANHTIVRSGTYKEDHPALEMSLVHNLEGFMTLIGREATLTELLSQHGYNEAAVYKAIHFLLTKGLISFSKTSAGVNPQEQLKTLKKIWLDIQNKNAFEVVDYLGIGNETVTRAQDLSDEVLPMLGERPSDQKSEAFRLWTQIRNKVQDSCNTYLDGGQRQKYKQSSQRSEAEKKIKATTMMEEAKQALQLNQYAKAAMLLSQVGELNSQIAQYHLYNAWAKIGTIEPAKRTQNLKDIEFELMQVPPDEKYDMIFSFVTGLFCKAKGDIPGAKKAFEKCLAMNSSMIVARRELNLLTSQNKGKEDILSMDLKKMVSGFFKKK